MRQNEFIAYFSMEIALHPDMPTYSGGLGILAGDTIRSAADLKVPMVAITLVHRKGYFNQSIDQHGWQFERPAPYPVERFYGELPERIEVKIEGRVVKVRAWEYFIQGETGHQVRVLLLDTDLPENSDWDRTITDHLYGGNAHYRLCQEVVLGIAGVRMLRALGYSELPRFHMNEGHAALLGLELLDERARWFGRQRFDSDDVEAIKTRCVFTTHTPVPAGHDRYPLEHVARVLGRNDLFDQHEVFCCEGELNMTYLALNLSHYVNGVAKKHGEVSRKMLTPKDSAHNYEIDHITNGVHLVTWAAPPMAKLFDKRIPGWRADNAMLRGVLSIPTSEIEQAHLESKRTLIETIKLSTGVEFCDATLTIGFARRVASYKRATLLLRDCNKLKEIAGKFGRLQIVYAGKAHPQDEAGKKIIHEIVYSKFGLKPEVEIVYLENYDWELAKLIVAGVDIWLNTPQPPLEASGTSGMKAALNGVPNLSILDGWWIEGFIKETTGWAIGAQESLNTDTKNRLESDATALYSLLAKDVMPTFYNSRQKWVNMMRAAIALNASYFNTQRMLQQYVLKAYFE